MINNLLKFNDFFYIVLLTKDFTFVTSCYIVMVLNTDLFRIFGSLIRPHNLWEDYFRSNSILCLHIYYVGKYIEE